MLSKLISLLQFGQCFSTFNQPFIHSEWKICAHGSSIISTFYSSSYLQIAHLYIIKKRITQLQNLIYFLNIYDTFSLLKIASFSHPVPWTPYQFFPPILATPHMSCYRHPLHPNIINRRRRIRLNPGIAFSML